MISGVIVAMASGRTGAVAPEKKGFGNMSKKTVAVVFGGQSSNMKFHAFRQQQSLKI